MLWFHFFSLHYCSFLTDSYMPSIIIASTTECKLAKATSNQQNIISFTLPLFCKFILLIVNSLSFGNRQLFWNGFKYDLLVKETHINFMILCTYMGNGFSKRNIRSRWKSISHLVSEGYIVIHAEVICIQFLHSINFKLWWKIIWAINCWGNYLNRSNNS